jgi:hypothetical protein
VGQQVVLTVRIVRRGEVTRVDWIHPLGFPDFRSVRLPGRAEVRTVSGTGLELWAREERWALFASRTGLLQISKGQVRCTQASLTSAAPKSQILEVPPLKLEVVELPLRGRPDGYAGGIGPLTLRTQVDPAEITLGQSVRVSLLIRGGGDLWSLVSPVTAARWAEGVELFPSPPEIRTELGDRVFLRRFYRVDVVPRRAGTLVIPSFEVAFYDPESDRYGLASSSVVRVEVRPPPDPMLERSADASSRRSALSAEPGSGFAWRWVAGGLLLVVGVGISAALRRARRLARWSAVAEALSVAEATRELDSRAEAAALARALRGALEIVGDDGANPSSQIPSSRDCDSPAREAVELLSRLDELRFSTDPDSPDHQRVAEVLRRLGAPTPGY